MTDAVEAENNVITCIKALYTQTGDIKLAEQWLKEFQIASPFAWSVADHILHNATLPFEVHFFAASTLYMKIQMLASIDLNPVSRASLRDSLVGHIRTHSKGNEPLRAKLAQAIAALALHMGLEWPQVVSDIVSSFSTSPDLIRSLFSILEVLPEECENYHSTSRVNKEVAAAYRDQIRTAAPGLIKTLGDPGLLGNAKDISSKAQIMKCFANWLRVCEEAHVSKALSGNPLMIAAFDALGSHDLFESALSAVCELVIVSTHSDLRQLVEYSVARANSFLPAFKKAVAEEDEETSKGLCHLFTEMAGSYLPMMLSGDPTVLPLTEVMLECVAHTDVETAAITFRFWQQLGEGLEKSEKKDLVAGFAGSIFPRLFESLYRLACYPDDFSTWPQDMQEDFRDIRKNEVVTTLRTTTYIMGTSACFARVAVILQKQLGEGGYAATGNWRLLEGAIYCVRALARCVDSQPGVDPVIGSILKILPQLPNHKEIHYTSLLIVGRYADWLKTDPSLLWPLFSYVVSALGNADTAPSAAVSFKNVCASCSQNIADTYLREILQVVVNTMQSKILDVNEHTEVIDGVSQVISTLPFETSVSSLNTLCQPLVASINIHKSDSASTSTALSDDLCKLATLFLCTKTFHKHPGRTAPIPEALWPVLEPIFSTHSSYSHVIDQLLRCVRYLFDNFPTSFTPSTSILPSLLAHMKATYKQVRYPSILYTSAAFFKYNSRKSEYSPLLWDLLLDLSHTTLKTPADAVGEADMVGEYCGLLEYAVHDFSLQIRSTPGLVEGIAGWCASALVQIAQLSRQDRTQREAFYSICRLFTTFMQEGMDFTTTGEVLVRALVTCITLCGISLSRSTALCEVLRRILRYPPSAPWVASAVETTTPSTMPPAPKARFLAGLATAASFTSLDEARDAHEKGNGQSRNGKVETNGRDHRAEEAERELVNSAMDFADMCRKFRRT